MHVTCHRLTQTNSTLAFSKRLIAVAIHKKVNVYEIGSASSTPVRLLLENSYHVGKDLTSNIFQKLVVFEGHTQNVTSVSFHSEGKWVVTGSEDGTIRIWDLRYSVHLLGSGT
jgi:target of rapamycin complex subunit LST8